MWRYLLGLGLLISPFYVFANTTAYCQTYAAKAVQQHKTNLNLGCGFSGLRWNNDQNGQYRWCMTVSKTISGKEDTIRTQDLAHCQKQKQSANSALPLPKACISSSAKPVKTLLYAFRYETETTMPVQPNGLIRYDFNLDRQDDYLFLETTPNHTARLVQCMSQGATWQRTLTDMQYDSRGSTTWSTGYTFERQQNQLKITVNYFGHNEGSCDTQAFYTFHPNQKSFKLTRQKGDCYTVEPDYPLSPPTPPTLKPKG